MGLMDTLSHISHNKIRTQNAKCGAVHQAPTQKSEIFWANPLMIALQNSFEPMKMRMSNCTRPKPENSFATMFLSLAITRAAGSLTL